MMGEFSSSSACRQQLLIALPHFITTPNSTSRPRYSDYLNSSEIPSV